MKKRFEKVKGRLSAAFLAGAEGLEPSARGFGGGLSFRVFVHPSRPPEALPHHVSRSLRIFRRKE